MTATLLIATALLAYLGASGTLVASFAGGRTAAPRTGAALTAAGLVLHGAGLAAFTIRYAELPLVGLAPSLCTLAFIIALLHIAAMLVRETKPLGLVLIPLVAVLLAIALVLGFAPSEQSLGFRGVWFSLHVLLAFVGYAGLTLAFAAGLLYLLQFRELKDKRLGRVFRFFPSLPALDAIGRQGVFVGFPALTIGLLLGFAWTARFQQDFGLGEPQVIWGVLTWLVFAVLVAVRLSRGTDGERRAALASVVGFTVVVTAFVMLRTLMGAERLFL